MTDILYYLVPLFLLISLAYSMAGQGGASAFLAIMALFGVSYAIIPSTALACNIAASLGVIYHFRKAGHLEIRLVVPFILTSIPAALYGGTLTIPERTFEILLAVILIFTSIKTFFWKAERKPVKKPSDALLFTVAPLIGLLLGLLAGVVGIGGGILLLPTLLFLRWGNIKQAALASGLFTFFNSISGLIGHGLKGKIDIHFLIPLILAVIVGSQIGAHIGASKASGKTIQNIFAAILFIIAIRLLLNFA